MESETLTKTLEALKAISDLETALAEFYLFCSEIRETEKGFWLALEQDEQKHARKVQEISQMLEEGQSLVAANTSFNPAPIYNLKNFIAKSLKRLKTYQIPTDFKTLLSIAWNIEYSIAEIKYNDLFSIAEQEYEKLMQTILTETASHRGQLGSKISAMRNSTARGHNRAAAKMQNETPKGINQKRQALKLP